MSNFRTQFERQRVNCSSGNVVAPEFSLRYDDDGNEYFEVIGEKNLYDEIQSHKLSVDINYILARFASGDTEALSKRQGVYGDFSRFPRTYAEMLNTVNDAQAYFDALPLEVKHQFGDSMQQWLSQYGTDDWSRKMGYSQKVENLVVNPDAAAPAPAVKEGASDES